MNKPNDAVHAHIDALLDAVENKDEKAALDNAVYLIGSGLQNLDDIATALGDIADAMEKIADKLVEKLATDD